MADLEVTLAGAITLRRGDRRVGDRAFRAGQLRLVTALLVLERPGPVSVDLLAGELWTGEPPARWRVAVRVLVSQFRGLLVDVGLERDAIVGQQGRYLVSLDPVRVDVEDAADGVVRARACLERGDLGQAAESAGAARAVLSRPVLPTVESAWVDRLRERTARQHLDALVMLGAARTGLGDHDGARSVLDEATGRDPLREDAWRGLMQAEAAGGNLARALSVYEACRRVLADELGVDPARETQQLHAEILGSVPDPDAWPGAPTDEVPAVLSDPSPTPYVGLRAFTSEDAEWFFGRDAEVQSLVERLVRHGIVAVVGPSGVGKSSLVRAGLLPALARGAIPDADTWVTAVVVPGTDPLKGLARELDAVADGVDGDDLHGLLRADADGLHLAAERILVSHPPTARLLLVVDQFEEVFTLGEHGRTAAFVALLERATARLDRRVSVVVTLRADFYDRAAEVAGLADLLSHSQFVVPPLEGEQVEAVVAGPARRGGASLEPGLLGRIVADVVDEPGSLPLLQHLLFELWEHRVDHVLTRGAYEDLGGVAGALANRAEAVHAGLERDERAVARRVLLRGVQPGEDGGDAKRPVAEAELVGPTDDREAVEAVVQRLVDARLLVASHDAASGRTVELAHDALIDAWPRLRAWVDEARGWLLDHRRLTVAAHDWDAHDRHDDWLLAGLPLDEAHDLLLADGRGDVDLHLSPSEHEFVTASLAARDEDLAREQQRVDHQRRLERRSVRRLQALVGVVVLVALVAGTLWYRADARADVAAVETLVSEASAAAGRDPQLSLLLALEGHRRWTELGSPPGHGVDQALHDAIASEQVVGFFPDVGELVAVDPEGAVFAVGSGTRQPGGTLDLRDADTGDLLHRLPDHVTDLLLTASFSPDGALLASGVGEERLRIWDRSSGELVTELHGPAGTDALQVGEFSPDGRFVTGRNVDFPTGNGRTLVWELETGDVVADLPRPPWPERTFQFGPTETTFSPDGTLLAIAPTTHPSLLQVMDTATWQEHYSIDLDDVPVNDVAFSPDGEWLAIGGAQVQVVEAETGDFQRAIPLQDGLTGVDGLAWFPDSERLAVGTDDLQVWNPFTAESPLRPLPVSGRLGTRNNVYLRDGGTTLFTGSLGSDGVRVLDVSPGADAELAWLPAAAPAAFAFSPSGDRLAVDGADGRVDLWDTASWEVDTQLDVMTGSVGDLSWQPGGTTLAVGGPGMGMWDVASDERRFELGLAEGFDEAWPLPMAWTVDGDHLALSRNDWPVDAPTVVEVVTADGAPVATLTRSPGDYVEDLVFTPDGRSLLVARMGGLVPNAPAQFGLDIWDWRAGTVRTIDTPAGDVAVHPDGSMAVTADLDGSGHVWDLTTGDEVATLAGHDAPAWAAAWSPAGDVVATGGADATVKLWDPAVGELRAELDFPDAEVGQVGFDPTGRTLVAASDTGDVRAWALDLDRLVALAEAKVLRDFTTDECREYLDLDACPA